MSNYIKDKVIIMTGASSGFGRLAAIKLAEMGGKLILAARSENKLKELYEEINAKGGQADYIVTDTTNEDDVKAMAQKAIDKFGAIDVIVNNAGIMPLAYFADHEKASVKWDECIDTNIKGVIYGISAVYDQMIKQGHGHVVTLSSIYGNYPLAGSAVYQATKIAVRYLSESLRQESQGVIRTSIVSPTGFARTGLYDTMINPAGGISCIGLNMERHEHINKMISENTEVRKYRGRKRISKS